MTTNSMTGGCQCGAVRFAATLPLGRASLCAFNDPTSIPPTIQHDLPVRTPEEAAKAEPYFASIVSYQHPDHDAD